MLRCGAEGQERLQGTSTVNYQGNAWKYVAKGECLKIGGTLAEHKGNARPVPKQS
jgi:uncharacterized membrane protein